MLAYNPFLHDRPADTHNNTCKLMKVFWQISIRLIYIDWQLLLKYINEYFPTGFNKI